jgi:HEAT repeat protein
VLELIAYPALAFGAGLLSVYQSHRSFRRKGEAVASACGLTVEEASNFWSTRLFFKARAGPVQVRIEGPRRYQRTHGHAARTPRVVVVAPWPPGFTGVRIRPEADKPHRASEIEVGDEPFDKAFYIVGPLRLLFALLDEKARRLMIAANAGKTLEIAGGELRVDVSFRQMTETLPFLLALTRCFSQPLDIAQRLAESSRLDSSAEVRLRNLLLLVHEFPGEPGTLEALRLACIDVKLRIRLRAAQELGAEGRGVLAELAEGTADDAVSAQAVASLGRELPLERARAILSQALHRRLLQTARACLKALGSGGAPEDVDTLAEILARETDELAAAAAQALGATGNPAAEAPLLLALGHERMDIRIAAAKALGLAGSAAAVLPLQEAAAGWGRQELRSAVRQAVAAIQARLQGAAPGQLSLAETQAGRLSLAEEKGQLSLADPADDAEGRLSLSSEERPPRPV